MKGTVSSGCCPLFHRSVVFTESLEPKLSQSSTLKFNLKFSGNQRLVCLRVFLAVTRRGKRCPIPNRKASTDVVNFSITTSCAYASRKCTNLTPEDQWNSTHLPKTQHKLYHCIFIYNSPFRISLTGLTTSVVKPSPAKPDSMHFYILDNSLSCHRIYLILVQVIKNIFTERTVECVRQMITSFHTFPDLTSVFLDVIFAESKESWWREREHVSQQARAFDAAHLICFDHSWPWST